MKNLELNRAWWSNSVNNWGQVLYGLEYKDGNKSVKWLAESVDAAKEGAIALGLKNSIPAELIDYVQRSIDREKHLSLIQTKFENTNSIAKHQKDVVCGVVKEEPVFKKSVLTPLKFAKDIVAIPTLGGIISDLPLSLKDQRRFPENVCLPVTLAASKLTYGGWVVCEVEGIGGVAMTIAEAYERGLREAPNWVPDMSGVSCVPSAGEINPDLR